MDTNIQTPPMTLGTVQIRRDASLPAFTTEKARFRKLADTIQFLSEESFYANGINLPAINHVIRLLAAELEREMSMQAPFPPAFRG